MAADSININITAQTGPLSAALAETTGQTGQLGAALKESGAAGEAAGAQIAEGMQKASYSTMEARESARLFSEEMGVRLPRALLQVAAQSELLAPLLAAAFPVIAIGAFLPIVEQAVDKLGKFAGTTYTATEDSDKFAASMAKATAALEAEQKKAQTLDREIQMLGKTTAEKEALKLKFDTEDAQGNVGAVTKKIAELETRLAGSGLTAVQIFSDAMESGFGMGSANADAARKNVEQLTAELKVWTDDLSTTVKAGDEQTTIDKKTALAEQVAAVKAAHDAQIKTIMEAAAAGVNLTSQVKLDATQQAEAIGLIAQAHRNVIKTITEEASAAATLGGEKQLAVQKEQNDLVIAQFGATVKVQEAQGELNVLIGKGKVEQAEAAVEMAKAGGHKKQEVAAEQALIAALKQEAAEQEALLTLKEQAAIDTMAANSEDQSGAAFQNAYAQYQQLENQKYALTVETEAKIAKVVADSWKKQGQTADQYFAKFNSEFASSVSEVVEGHETMAKAAMKMAQQSETAVISYLVKEAAKRAEVFLIDEAFKSASLAHFLTALGLKQAAQSGQGAAAATSNAAVAATGAAAAEAPIPIIGPALAEAAAAGMMGSMSAYIGLASAQQGGVVGDFPQLTQLHPREMVLPADLSERVQNMTGNSGGDTHLHVHAIDASGVAAFFRKNSSALGAGMHKSIREGHFNMASAARGK